MWRRTNEGLKHFTNIAKKIFQSRETNTRKSEEEKYRQSQMQKKLNATNSLPNQEVNFDKNEENNIKSFVTYNDFPENMHEDNIYSNEGNVDVCSAYIMCIMKLPQLTLLSINSKQQENITQMR